MNRPINLNLGLGKCPKCSKRTLKEVNEREVIGSSQIIGPLEELASSTSQDELRELEEVTD